jgi:hypothetical protein
LFAANIKADNTDNTLFADWDAKSFSFSPVRLLGDIGYSHLYNTSDLSNPTIISTQDLESKNIPQLDDHDCYNVYNDMEYQGFEFQ